jgi:hypothetical protein
VRAGAQRLQEIARGEGADVTIALQSQLFRMHGSRESQLEN